MLALNLLSCGDAASGRSKGTAEVVYERRTDALEAIKRFNDVCLDGKPLVMQLCKTTVSEDRSYITTLSSGISVTDPKTKRMETTYYQAGFDSMQQPVRYCLCLALLLKSWCLNGNFCAVHVC